MNQFRPEDLQAPPQFFNLVNDFFFDVGSLLDLIADVDGHQSLERGRRSREASVSTRQLYTRENWLEPAFPGYQTKLFVVLGFLYDARRKSREGRKFLRRPLQKGDCFLGAPGPVMDGNLV